MQIRQCLPPPTGGGEDHSTVARIRGLAREASPRTVGGFDACLHPPGRGKAKRRRSGLCCHSAWSADRDVESMAESRWFGACPAGPAQRPTSRWRASGASRPLDDGFRRGGDRRAIWSLQVTMTRRPRAGGRGQAPAAPRRVGPPSARRAANGRSRHSPRTHPRRVRLAFTERSDSTYRFLIGMPIYHIRIDISV